MSGLCLGVGRKFQTPTVFKELTLLDNLRLALKYGRGLISTLTAAFRIDSGARIDEILHIVGLGPKGVPQGRDFGARREAMA